MSFLAPVTREYPPFQADERTSLASRLDFQRATVLLKLDGVTDDQGTRPMVASGLSLLGLVKHLAEAEHTWFGQVFAGGPERSLFGGAYEDAAAEFRLDAGETVDVIVAGYLAACAQSRHIVERADSLDVLALSAPGGTPTDLRAIHTHMIEETARHNGHLDILRELLDGRTGF